MVKLCSCSTLQKQKQKRGKRVLNKLEDDYSYYLIRRTSLREIGFGIVLLINEYRLHGHAARPGTY